MVYRHNEIIKRSRHLIVMAILTIAAITLGLSLNTTAPAGAAGVNEVQINGAGSYATVQAAVDAAVDGDTINIGPGTFVGTVDVTKNNLTFEGSGEDSTFLDVSGIDYGFANNDNGYNVIMKDFTVQDAGHYGVKLSGGGTATLEDITVKNSSRTEIDFNGLTGVTLTNVTADGMTTSGNGISFSDTDNILINSATTTDNAWGGVALYTDGCCYGPGINGVTITSLSATEDNPLYVQTGAAETPVTGFSAPQFKYAVTNDEFRAEAPYFTFYQKTLADAETFGLALHTAPWTPNSDSAITRLSDGWRLVPDTGFTIKAAIEDAPTSGTVRLLDGTHDSDDSQVLIDKDLKLWGGGKDTTIVESQFNTGSGGDARGWFLVDSGVNLDMRKMTLDGDGQLIWQAIRHKGHGYINQVHFKNILYNPSTSYAGTAIAAFGDAETDITTSTFTNIGRVGVLYFGTGVSDSRFTNNTYEGKGIGDWLDYALDISAGADITVVNNDISNNYGVASSDGSVSAGAIVTTYFAPGTKADFRNNTFTNNSNGILVGFDGSDSSVALGRGNTFTSNDLGVSSTVSLVDFRGNYWGDNSGPTDSTADDGSIPETNPSGTGDVAGANVWYDGWTTIDTTPPTMSNINMLVSTDGGSTYTDDDYVTAGDYVRVEVESSDTDSGVKDVEFRVKHASGGGYIVPRVWIDTPAYGNVYQYDFQIPSDGEYINTHAPISEVFEDNIYWARATDNAGNYNHGISNLFTYDESKPSALITFPANGDTLQNDFVVLGDTSDAESGISHVEFDITMIDAIGGSYVSTIVKDAAAVYDDLTDSFSYDTDPFDLADGFYRLKVQAFDMAGNWKYHYVDVEVDNTGPALGSVVLNGQNVDPGDIRDANCEAISNFYLVSGEIDLVAMLSDAVGDVSSAKYKVRKVNSGGCTVSSIFSSGNVSMSNTSGDTWDDLTGFDTSTVPADGEYTIRLETTDNSGNTTVNFIDILIDNSAPTVDAGIDEGTVTAAFAHSGTATDTNGVSTTEWSVLSAPGGAVVTIGDVNSLSTTFSADTDGAYEIQLEATDTTGNTSTDTFTFTWDTPPAVLGTSTTGGESGSSSSATGGTGLNTNVVSFTETEEVATTDEDGEVAGDQDNADDEGEVMAETTTAQVENGEVEDGCLKILGICWYWWLLTIPLIIFIWWIATREDEE